MFNFFGENISKRFTYFYSVIFGALSSKDTTDFGYLV